MTESFENFDYILRDCVKGKVHKNLVETLNRYKKQEDERNSEHENNSEQILEHSESAVERD